VKTYSQWWEFQRNRRGVVQLVVVLLLLAASLFMGRWAGAVFADVWARFEVAVLENGVQRPERPPLPTVPAQQIDLPSPSAG
jgi:hypothetical protein